MSHHVLLVDNDERLLETIQIKLEERGCVVDTAISGERAIELIRRLPLGYAVVLLDYRMPELNGAETAKKLLEINPSLLILIYSADDTLEAHRASMKFGAYDFIKKDIEMERLYSIVENYCHKYDLATQVLEGPKEDATHILESIGMIGVSNAMKDVAALVKRFGRADGNVLIRGESGVGKELVARAIHKNSSRNGKPFIAVNCAAIPGGTG